MYCQVRWERLSVFTDGQSDEKEARELELHIKDCAFCRQRIGLLKAQKKLLGSLTPQEEPVDFDRGFQERLSQALERQRSRQAQYAFAAAATFFIAVAVSAFLALGPAFLQGELPLVLASKGAVETTLPGKTVPVFLVKGDRIRSGQRIITGQDGEVDLILKNKYVMKIKPDSDVSVASLIKQKEKGLTALYLKEGSVAARTDQGFKGCEFLVRTKTASAHIKGTAFMVGVEPVKDFTTSVAVLTGVVEVKSSFVPARGKDRPRVSVNAGEKTMVRPDSVPSKPQRLASEEWQALQEIYGLGRKLQVALIITSGPERVYELLKPCPLYISDRELKIAPEVLKETISVINQAIESNDRTKHLRAIENLENIASEYKNKSYSGQLLLFVGAYYRYIDEYEKAIAVFESVAREFKDRQNIASLAQCSIAVIYENDLKDLKKAQEAYDKVLRDFPKSPESIVARGALLRIKYH